MKLSRTIKGRKVRLTIERRHFDGEYLAKFNDRLLINKAKEKLAKLNDADFKDICRLFVERDLNSFIKKLMEYIQKNILHLLKQHPEFITSDNFEVHIVYDKSISNVAAYWIPLSSDDKVYISFDIFRIFEWLILGKITIQNMITHEFTHHYDRCFLNRQKKMSDRRSEIFVKGGAISLHSNTITDTIKSVRAEGIARFSAGFKESRTINIKVRHEKELIRYLDAVLEDSIKKPEFPKEKNLYIVNNIVGEQLACIISIRDVVNAGKGEFIQIKPTRFFLFGNKEYPIEKLKKFYGKIDFSVNFVQDTEIDKIVFSSIQKLTKLSHLGFIKEYEESSIRLGLKPTITFEQYQDYRRKCFYNDVGR